MSEWVTCPHCGLKHRERPDSICPRCKQLVGGEASFSSHTADRADLDGYGGDSLPSSRTRRLAQIAAEQEETAEEPPWKTLVGGLALLGFAWYLHIAFGELATGERESMRVWWVLAIMHDTVGPGATVAFLAVLGIFSLIMGVRELFA